MKNTPTFNEWLTKYFEEPKKVIVYVSKNNKKLYLVDELLKKYNKAYSNKENLDI